MAALRKAYGMPIGIWTPKWLMEIGAFVIRTESELTLKSRYSVPGKLLKAGFTFLHPTWSPAVQALAWDSKNR
jgi:NAD dependent epimerase/dehydratase family enzyme